MMKKRIFLGIAIAVAAALAGCGGGGGDGRLACDSSISSNFKPDTLTSVLLVKAFKKGDPLILSGTATSTTPLAANDMCFVKLNVGPGNPGPVTAPSTSPGIGIEVWLPTKENWNRRIHVKGGGGWAGGPQASLTSLVVNSGSGGNAPDVAGIEGAVSATTDTGHSVSSGAFAMNPDGTINETLWKDFSERGIHEMAVKTKALTRAYYAEDAKYAYWNGFSTGGRQGMKEVQANPSDFDGVLAGAPVVNWSKFITNELYPQIVMQRDLGGVLLTAAQHSTVGAAAVASCGTVGGVNLGYVLEPFSCRYDPTRDLNVLCASAGGTNSTAGCVNAVQAQAFNKIWYGQTPDGSVPAPATDNGTATTTAANQKWYGLTRGTSLLALAGAPPFGVASDQVALELQDSTIAQPSFLNAKANGADGWKALSYAQLNSAWDLGVTLQPRFANINTDSTDLSAFRDRGGKVLSYHGLSDVLVPPQGTIHYYNRVAAAMGGTAAIQSFYRLYMIPGMSHGFSNGSAVAANVPLPSNGDLYKMLTDWVEKGIAPPTRVDLSSTASSAFPAVVTRPICLFPLKPTYTGGDATAAASYTCS